MGSPRAWQQWYATFQKPGPFCREWNLPVGLPFPSDHTFHLGQQSLRSHLTGSLTPSTGHPLQGAISEGRGHTQFTSSLFWDELQERFKGRIYGDNVIVLAEWSSWRGQCLNVKTTGHLDHISKPNFFPGKRVYKWKRWGRKKKDRTYKHPIHNKLTKDNCQQVEISFDSRRWQHFVEERGWPLESWTPSSNTAILSPAVTTAPPLASGGQDSYL